MAEAEPYYGRLGYGYAGASYPHYQSPYVYSPSYSYLPSLLTGPVTYNYQPAPLASVAPTLPSVAAPIPGVGPAVGRAAPTFAGVGSAVTGLDPAVGGAGPASGGAGPVVAGLEPTVEAVAPVVRGVAVGSAGGGVAHSVAAVSDVSHLEERRGVTASQYHAQDEQGNYSFGYTNPVSARMETGNPLTGVRGSVFLYLLQSSPLSLVEVQ